MNNLLSNPSTTEQKIQLPEMKEGIDLFMKRLDLVHPHISGNKWYKLKYNLIEARKNNFDVLVTFGGAYSNHIYAVSAAGKEYGFETIGLIRGEEHFPLNPTLSFASEQGMELRYIDRKTYRDLRSKKFKSKILNEYKNCYLIPEGGSNELAVKGAAEIIKDIKIDYDIICTACGTGGTLAGIIAGLDGNKNALGFSVLKGGDFLIKDVSELIKSYNGKEFSNWDVNLDYHFDGYAKISPGLILFTHNFERLNNIKLDPIYTGKMMYGLQDLISRKFFEKNTKILALHTGGLQGIEGMKPYIKRILYS